MKPPSSQAFGKWMAMVIAAAALLAVYGAYQSPQLVMDLASRLWACF
jgi:hypothetical protein